MSVRGRNAETGEGLRPAVFLDRDGTIIEDRGHLRDPSQVVFYPDAFPALRRLGGHFALFIVTHQPGIAAGLISPAEADAVNRHVVDVLRARGVEIEAVYCCPHARDEGCPCIKPNSFFMEQAARNCGLDLKQSFVVGDHPNDVRMAANAGATGIYVLTGHGLKHRAELGSGAVVVQGIREAAEWIFSCLDMRRLEEREPGILDRAAELIRNGGVVAFPTETVYGLGANAFDGRAVARIFEIKRRPRFDPLIVHVAGPESMEQLVTDIPRPARLLMERFWPGPLTLVLEKSGRVPDIVTAGLPTVAVRMPRHPMAIALIERCGSPIAAPSANLFGCVSPTAAEHVAEQLGDNADLILDGGPTSVGIESTVLAFLPDGPVLLRHGGVEVEAIEAAIGPVSCDRRTRDDGRVESPGMLPRHYAPRTPLKTVDRGETEFETWGGKVGYLAFRSPPQGGHFEAVEVLSPDGDMREAAARLFGAIRRLDSMGLDLILAELVPNEGLGRAVNDRLSRAENLHSG